MNYSMYHRHSYYSNVVISDVAVSNEDYAIRAVELGQQLICSCEHGTVGRYIEVYELAKKYNLKFLFGLEAYIVKNRFEKDATNAHIILLAKNENGRKAINRIVSEANISGFYYRARIDMELLLSLPKDDVWVTSACVGGLWKYEDSDDLILQVYNHFGNNFFLEVQNHNTQSQKDLNRRIIELSNRHNIKIIFGSDSHYIYEEQFKDRDDYLLSKHISYEDEQGWYMDYPTCDVAIERFKRQGVLSNAQIKEAIENTNILLNVEEYNSPVFSKTLKLPTIYPDCSQEEKNTIFSDLIWSQWNIEKHNVPKNKWEHYEDEIRKEVSVIVETGMADYFLLDYAVIKRGKELGGHITLTGRGSAPSFYTAKLLGFTTIDRISATVKLFPERFITKERILEAGTLPDIDLNAGNPEVFAEAQKQILGENHSYPMVAYGTLRPKAAWKLYARAKNIDFETANLISEQIDEYENRLKHAEEDEKDSISPLEFIDEQYHATFLESKRYLGIVSDGKIHPCAYLLYNGNIKEEIGLIKVKDNLCCIMDGLWAEGYKFLKNDLLKVSVVDLIYKIYERIGIEPHSLPELIEICKNDQKVWDVYHNAWTMGINQVEQTSTSGRVAKYSPTNISELSAFVAAVRPGFQSNYKQFEAREEFSYGIKSLDSLIQTEEFPRSYIIFQENSMQVMAYAGIPINQTYEIIKNIAKKRVEKVLKYKQQFLDGMTEKVIHQEGVSNDEGHRIAEMTWKIIEDSSRYSFNASHAYSVAGDSLYGAYLKSHYPHYFYEVFLRLMEQDGDKDRLNKAKEEATKAYGIRFPPYKFGQDNREIVADISKNEISSSLSSIKGFNSGIGRNMFELSQQTYTNFIDFLVIAEEKGYLSTKILDLIHINYFENFGNNLKLEKVFEEFTKGKLRYSKTHSEKTKNKRISELQTFWNSLPNEKLPFIQQICYEEEILGHVQATYPSLNKRYVYVLETDVKFAPRIQCYCLANGKQSSMKIQKKIFDNKIVKGGDILYIHNFKERPAVSFQNGKYVESLDEKCWWIERYDIVDHQTFDKILIP